MFVKAFWYTNNFCITESYNTNVSYQVFDHKITQSIKFKRLLKVLNAGVKVSYIQLQIVLVIVNKYAFSPTQYNF